MEVVLKPEFGYVLFVLVANYLVVHGWMSYLVVTARKKYNVPPPALYSNKTGPGPMQYNCVQRVQQNAFESQPTFYMLLILAGLRFPISSAIAGVIYLLARIVYTLGYLSGDPNKRYYGIVFFWPMWFLLGCLVKFGVELLKGAA